MKSRVLTIDVYGLRNHNIGYGWILHTQTGYMTDEQFKEIYGEELFGVVADVVLRA